MNYFVRPALKSILLLFILASSSPAYSATSNPSLNLDTGFHAALGTVGLSTFVDGPVAIRIKILRVISVTLRLLAVAAMGAMVYGGFLYVSALGNEDKARRGKTVIIYTVVGIIIIGISAVLVNALIAILSP